MVKITLDDPKPETTTFGQLKPGDWFLNDRSLIRVKLNRDSSGGYDAISGCWVERCYSYDHVVRRLNAEIKLTPVN